MTESDPAKVGTRKHFIPARPTGWLIRAAQELVRVNLSFENKLHVSQEDLSVFRNLPPNAGVILASNHADETDPRVCIELSRLTGRRFILMCNREAFDEVFGMAGHALQRLGYFSVERGVHDALAKRYAIDVVGGGQDILVIFPEGEIFYLNEALQHFHSGAVEIGMQAIIDRRAKHPDWTACVVPMAIKYHYEKSIDTILTKRIAAMEARLRIKQAGSLPERLRTIQSALLDRELSDLKLPAKGSKLGLTNRIMLTQEEILSEVEAKHNETPSGKRSPIDSAWKLQAELREAMQEQTEQEKKDSLDKDIQALAEVAHLSSWRPQYYRDTTSSDRLAEVVLKLERELYRIKRPQQLTNRRVFVKIAEPINLADHIEDYQQDAHNVRTSLTNKLQSVIQALIDGMVADVHS
jgi:hypothetical protein